MLTSFWVFVYVVFVVQISGLCTTIYLHRSLTHRALSLHPIVSGLMQVWLWLHTGINPREWAAVHRKHHHFTDVEGDPHSPQLEGLAKILLANAYLYKKEAKNPETIARYTRDIGKTWMEKNIIRRGWLGLGLGLAIAVIMLGVVAGPVAFILQAILYIFLNAMINGLGHVKGYKNFKNAATNLRWLAALTVGEGLHNNHHEFPTSPKFSWSASELLFDAGWWGIWLLEKLGWAETRRKASKA